MRLVDLDVVLKRFYRKKGRLNVSKWLSLNQKDYL